MQPLRGQLAVHRVLHGDRRGVRRERERELASVVATPRQAPEIRQRDDEAAARSLDVRRLRSVKPLPRALEAVGSRSQVARVARRSNESQYRQANPRASHQPMRRRSAAHRSLGRRVPLEVRHYLREGGLHTSSVEMSGAVAPDVELLRSLLD